VATSVVVSVALGWFGWLLVTSQRALEDKAAREQTIATAEATADAIAAGLRGRLADAGDRLSAWLSNPTSGAPTLDRAAVFAWDPTVGAVVSPAGALPFVPLVATPGPPVTVFAASESIEFAHNQPARAADQYRALATDPDPRVRAGAWLRLARSLKNSGDPRGALQAYEHLAALGAVRVDDGQPAGLVGLDGQRAMLRRIGNREGERRVADELQRNLDAGLWVITRRWADYYRDAVSEAPRPDSWQLAEAIANVWPGDSDLAARGQATGAADGRGVVVLWRASGSRAAMLAAFADTFFGGIAPAELAWQLADANNRPLAGRAVASGAPLARVIAVADSAAWQLRLWPRFAAPATTSNSGRAIVVMTSAMLLFVWGAAYFMARAIRREAEVSRLQSDFVAAVSHEFRSPLTTVRQMAEMLEMGRLTDEPRRQQYYSVLAGEAVRLQRLVETLLNFGRIEAGRECYEFRDVEAAEIVRKAVADVELLARESKMAIDVSGSDTGVVVHGDEDALHLALRNLIENAIKYSPGQPTVWVRWTREGERIAIRVIDRGLGIAPAERRAIFRKFVRGTAAVSAHAKGTGVGLAMVQHIVSAHGGEIHVESKPGEGSTFVIQLATGN
jgi:signal transduction histidine kinase